MKKLITFLLLPLALWGKIIEADRMQEISSYVDEDSWVMMDVDKTLIESSVHLGTVQWRTHIRNKTLALGYSKAESDLILDKFWVFVHHFVPVDLVDPEAPAVIKKLKGEGRVVLALTAREPIEIDHTRRELDSVQLDLSDARFPETFSLDTPYPSLYDKGVIYCGDNSKGETLRAFFRQVGRFPKRGIFIDDKLAQVEDVESELEEMGIECIGIRFSRADGREFDGKIADLQFSYLPHILSDQEAQAILDNFTYDTSSSRQ